MDRRRRNDEFPVINFRWFGTSLYISTGFAHHKLSMVMENEAIFTPDHWDFVTICPPLSSIPEQLVSMPRILVRISTDRGLSVLYGH